MSTNQVIVLETSGIQSELQANDNAIAALRDKYSVIPTEYKALSSAYSEVRQVRLAISKRWESKKKEIKDYRSALDTEAERLISMVAAIENPLRDAKHAIDEAKKREEAERARIEAERVSQILNKIKCIEILPFSTPGTVEGLEQSIACIKELVSDFDFKEFTDKARETYRISLETLNSKLHERKEFEAQQAILAEEKRKLEEEKAAIAAEKAKIAESKADVMSTLPTANGRKEIDITEARVVNPALTVKQSTDAIAEKLRNQVMQEQPVRGVLLNSNQPPAQQVEENSLFDVSLFDNENGNTELRIKYNDEVIETYYDDIEPAAKYFNSAFSWIPTELERAYALGFRDGKRVGNK